MKIRVYVVDFRPPRWLQRALFLGVLPLVILGLAALVYASAVTGQPDFSDGDVLTAAALNAHLGALQNQINTLGTYHQANMNAAVVSKILYASTSPPNATTLLFTVNGLVVGIAGSIRVRIGGTRVGVAQDVTEVVAAFGTNGSTVFFSSVSTVVGGAGLTVSFADSGGTSFKVNLGIAAGGTGLDGGAIMEVISNSNALTIQP